MKSVTGRISEIKQPRGGYIPFSMFEVKNIDDGRILLEGENLPPTLIGTATDYLTRFIGGEEKSKAFEICLTGAERVEELGGKGAKKYSKMLLSDIKGTDDKSVEKALRLSCFDVWVRSSPAVANQSLPPQNANPNDATIGNIQTFIERYKNFVGEYGPIVKRGMTFEPEKQNEEAYAEMVFTGAGEYGGYTATVVTGDADFMTSDTIWDMKVLRSSPTIKHSLQLAMYWIMGKHSGQKIFDGVDNVGIFNPRLNQVYTLNTGMISDETIKIIENDIIQYPMR